MTIFNLFTDNKLNLLFLFLLLSMPVHAQIEHKTCRFAPYIGPEIYYVKRTKEGGTQQTGTLYGVRVGVDSIQRYKIYWGADALWATGCLKGSRDNVRLKSQLTDTNVECRLGYTFQSKYGCRPSLTPYLGAGYFWETNCYKHPSPLTVHLKNTFAYIPVGFLSQIYLTPSWSIGLNLKVRILWDGVGILNFLKLLNIGSLFLPATWHVQCQSLIEALPVTVIFGALGWYCFASAKDHKLAADIAAGKNVKEKQPAREAQSNRRLVQQAAGFDRTNLLGNCFRQFAACHRPQSAIDAICHGGNWHHRYRSRPRQEIVGLLDCQILQGPAATNNSRRVSAVHECRQVNLQSQPRRRHIPVRLARVQRQYARRRHDATDINDIGWTIRKGKPGTIAPSNKRKCLSTIFQQSGKACCSNNEPLSLLRHIAQGGSVK